MKKPLTRIQAFVLHLISSVVVLLLIFLMLDFILYPYGFLFASKGFEIFKIIVLSDIFLGPLIMLVIFNPIKKSLKKDVAAVLIFQLSFLAFGIWTMYIARPVYIVFNENQFNVTTATEIEDVNLKEVRLSKFKSLPLFTPIFTGSTAPTDKKKLEQISFTTNFGAGINTYPQYLVPYEEQTNVIIKKALHYSNLTIKNKEQLNAIVLYFNNKKKEGIEVGFIPMLFNTHIKIVAINKSNGIVMAVF